MRSCLHLGIRITNIRYNGAGKALIVRLFPCHFYAMSSRMKVPPLYYNGREVDTAPSCFGLLKRSGDLLGDRDALCARMAEDGYLYLPGLLNTEDVLAARRGILERMQTENLLHPDFPLMDGVARPDVRPNFKPDLAKKNSPVQKMAYDGAMMDFFEMFLGGAVRHYDYTWLRTKCPGSGHVTSPHCDIVYMGRGTKNLFTAWTPLGDVPIEMGGLMIMEHSGHRPDALGGYWEMDVDTYCTNKEDAEDIESGRKQWGGSFNPDALALREQLGERWLTSEYSTGDVLVFGMFTLHASLDNQTDRFRLSTDTRYQLASDPVDGRWIGEDPIGHGPEAKVGMIC